MNSREKGKRGERQWRDELRANGYDARRGQQFAGGAESPDAVCDALGWIHFEVKAVERLNIEEAMEQARRDSVSAMKSECHELENGGLLSPALSSKRGEGAAGPQKVPVVAHRRNFRAWLVTMEAETFFKFLRGDVPECGMALAGGPQLLQLVGAPRRGGRRVVLSAKDVHCQLKFPSDAN